jgi:hypothetical protein
MELRQQLAQSRKANQSAVVAEKKRAKVRSMCVSTSFETP